MLFLSSWLPGRPGSAGQLAASADEEGSAEGLRKRPAGKEEAKAPEAAKTEAQGDGDRCPISGKQGRLDMPVLKAGQVNGILMRGTRWGIGVGRTLQIGLADSCVGARKLPLSLRSKVLAPWPPSWASRNLRTRRRPTSHPQLPPVELLWLERAS